MADIPRLLQASREQNRNISDEEATRLYYLHLGKMLESKNDASSRLRYAMVCLSYIEPFVRHTSKTGGVPPVIPPIVEATIFHAINGARGQLENICEIVDFLPELHAYKSEVGFAMLDLAAKVRAYLAEHPGTLQKDAKKALGATDGKLLSRVLHYMEIAKQIERKPHEKTWELYLRPTP